MRPRTAQSSQDASAPALPPTQAQPRAQPTTDQRKNDPPHNHGGLARRPIRRRSRRQPAQQRPRGAACDAPKDRPKQPGRAGTCIATDPGTTPAPTNERPATTSAHVGRAPPPAPQRPRRQIARQRVSGSAYAASGGHPKQPGRAGTCTATHRTWIPHRDVHAKQPWRACTMSAHRRRTRRARSTASEWRSPRFTRRPTEQRSRPRGLRWHALDFHPLPQNPPLTTQRGVHVGRPRRQTRPAQAKASARRLRMHPKAAGSSQ